MPLRAKLTLGFVLLAVVMVGIISAVDLGYDMQLQLDATLERADSILAVATQQVILALNRQRPVPLREVLRDPALVGLFKNVMLASHAILEVAVVDAKGYDEILLDLSLIHI